MTALTRRAFSGGVLGAATVLTKYHSLVLLACAFGWLASSPDGRRVLAGRRVWAGVAAGLVVLAPHGYWLLTDGRSPTEGIKDLVQAMIAEGVTVTTVGLGNGADGDLLRMIADTGGGRRTANAGGQRRTTHPA